MTTSSDSAARRAWLAVLARSGRSELEAGLAHFAPQLRYEFLRRPNRQVVIELIQEARQRGSAIVGIFHDAEVRDAVATRSFDLERYRASGAAQQATSPRKSPA